MSNWILITAEDLPTLPIVATKVLQVVGDPDSSAKDLCQVIEVDQALTERLLRMANSSLFGGVQKLANLQTAIARLGFNRVRNLTLIASTRDVLHANDEIATELWRHSLGVAICARMLGKLIGANALQLDQYFLAGLFHDLGKVLMNNQKPKLYQQIVETAVAQRRSASDVERELFRLTHEEVGALLLGKWGLAADLHEPVRYHHEIQREDCPTLKCPLDVAVVATADLVTNMLGIGLLNSMPIDPAGARSTQILGLSEERLMPVLEQLSEEFLAQSSAFD